MSDWEMRAPNPITHSARPVKPSATWKKNEETAQMIVIQLPDNAQRRAHLLLLAFWQIKTSIAMPVNLGRRSIRWVKRHRMVAPSQTSIVDAEQGQTLFGLALYNAINGGACKPDQELVTVLDVFKYIHAYVKKEVSKLKLAAAPEGTTDEASLALSKSINQSPVLVLPAIGRHSYHSNADLAHFQQVQEDLLNNPVCYRCGPPAPPDKPYIVRIGNNEVLLEWYNPPFAGVPPFQYKVYMRNKSRNFNKWREVYSPGPIVKTQFLVRDLPMGVGCQFKVSACNTGGWGLLSTETIYVTPGEESVQVTTETKWKRIQQGAMHDFKHDSRVMNSLSWLRNSMPTYLPTPVENMPYIPLNPQPKVKGKFDSDDEEEECDAAQSEQTSQQVAHSSEMRSARQYFTERWSADYAVQARQSVSLSQEYIVGDGEEDEGKEAEGGSANHSNSVSVGK
eukprot:gene26936-33587_t